MTNVKNTLHRIDDPSEEREEGFVNLHIPRDWKYEIDGKNYFKVGPIGDEDPEYIIENGRCMLLDGSMKTYDSMQKAYMHENEFWIEYDRELNRNTHE